MNKMILTVPHNFDAEGFCHVVTVVANDGKEHFDRYDYDLGDLVKKHYKAGDTVYALGNNVYLQPIGALIDKAKSPAPAFDEYEIDADFIDFEIIDAVKWLQGICPNIEFHFENCGDGGNTETPCDAEYFAEACYELFKAAGVKHSKHSA